MLAIAGPLVLLLVGMPVTASAVGTGHTSWQMRSQSGDYVGGGKDWSYSPANATITASGDSSHVSVRVDGATWWYADFEADSSRTLQPGATFESATRYPFNAESVPGLDVGGDGRGCNQLTGSFTVHEVAFGTDGTLQKFSATFEQHCEGDAPALIGSIAWNADNPAEPLPELKSSSVRVQTTRQSYDYGDPVRVAAHLGTTSSTRTVSIYATPYGGAKKLLKRAAVDGSGNLAVTTRVYKRTTFTVEYDGNATTVSARATRVVTVHSQVVNRMIGHYKTERGAHLYHARANPKLAALVKPNHVGDCAYFRVQRLVNGNWRALAVSSCIQLDDNSVAGVVLTGTHRVGERIRMRAEWRGNTANLADFGSWQVAQFTR